MTKPATSDPRLWAVLISMAALALRLHGLDVKSLSHPEIYIPGIDLVPGISEPPPRHSIGETLDWHFHDEPHPMGAYLAMLGWTRLFGTGEFALRLPAALFGAASVALIYLVTARAFGTKAALIAAAMLALHGFHVHWSQAARMYAMGACLGLLATWLLLHLTSARRPYLLLEVGFVAVAVIGVQTVEMFWPFLAIQLAWLALSQPAPADASHTGLANPEARSPARVAQVVSIALMLAAPAHSHAVYGARRGAAPPPAPSFLQDYFSFGFAFEPDTFMVPELRLPSLASAAVLILAVGLVGLGALRASRKPQAPPEDAPLVPFRLTAVVALAMAGVMLWLSRIAHRRNGALALLSLLPLLAVAIPHLVQMAGLWRRKLLPQWTRSLEVAHREATLFSLLAIVPPLVLYVASQSASVLAPRAFLLFVPYLLILSAAGLASLSERVSKQVAAACVAGAAALFAASAVYSSPRPLSPRDYKTLAARMAPQMRPGDLVLVRSHDWSDTPLFYYLRDARYVATDHRAALDAEPRARAWLILWPSVGGPPEPGALERLSALQGYEQIASVRALRAEARLYVRGDAD
jgi:4-amino-4-deoxy-L-arabinose transferase-like glycosyltransferase